MRGAGGVGDVAFARGLCGGAADIIDIIDRIDSGGVRRGGVSADGLDGSDRAYAKARWERDLWVAADIIDRIDFADEGCRRGANLSFDMPGRWLR